MSINVIHFEHEGRAQWGVVRNRRVTPIAGSFANTAALVRFADVAALSALTGATLDEKDVTLLSPVTRDQQFVCQGANYRQHMIESGMDPDAKTYNMIFTKASSCIVPANHAVIRPRHVQCLDYEIELGLVLKRDIMAPVRVTDAELCDFVAGVVIVNDYSARDVQIPQTQFYKGKSYRTFGPVGPYLCLLERADFAALQNLDLQLTVNGQVRQRDNTANLIYSPSETLTELSGVHDLHVGDLLATGTPAGCALSVPSPAVQKLGALLPERTKWQMFVKMQAKRPQYLKPGDVVEARIASPDGRIDLGTQRNVVVADAS
jgi:2,4-didehydro-3-deoxy-L-rhamnonate hydrolase